MYWLGLATQITSITLLIGILVLLWRRNLLRTFPFFFSYVLFGLMRTIVGSITLSTPRVYFYFYWVTAPLETILTILAVYESFSESVSHLLSAAVVSHLLSRRHHNCSVLFGCERLYIPFNSRQCGWRSDHFGDADSPICDPDYFTWFLRTRNIVARAVENTRIPIRSRFRYLLTGNCPCCLRSFGIWNTIFISEHDVSRCDIYIGLGDLVVSSSSFAADKN